MKNLVTKVFGSVCGLGILGIIYLQYEESKNKIEQLQNSYDSLKIKCDSLNVEKDYWVKKAVNCQLEMGQKFLEESKAFREELEQKETMHEAKYKDY